MVVVALDREAARATAAHLSCMFTVFSGTLDGEPSTLTLGSYLEADIHTRVAATNAATIAMVDHSDAGRLAELIIAGAQRFLELVAQADPAAGCETPCTERE